MRIAEQAAVAAAGQARGRPGTGAKIATFATPNSAGFPVVWNREVHFRAGCSFPTSREVGHTRRNGGVGEYGRPLNGEK